MSLWSVRIKRLTSSHHLEESCHSKGGMFIGSESLVPIDRSAFLRAAADSTVYVPGSLFDTLTL